MLRLISLQTGLPRKTSKSIVRWRLTVWCMTSSKTHWKGNELPWRTAGCFVWRRVRIPCGLCLIMCVLCMYDYEIESVYVRMHACVGFLLYSVRRSWRMHASLYECTSVGMKPLVVFSSRSVKKQRLFCGKEKINILGFPSWKRSAAVGKVVQTLDTYADVWK